MPTYDKNTGSQFKMPTYGKNATYGKMTARGREIL